MKKLVFLLGILAFTVGMSYGQNVVDVDQSGGSSNDYTNQDGASSEIYIEQIGLSADPGTGFVNDAWATQKGNNALIDVYQNAGTYNDAWLQQVHGTDNSKIEAVQNATDEDNYLWVDQGYFTYNHIDIEQNAGKYNYAKLIQGYTANDMFIDQQAADYNFADVKQVINKKLMYLYGADADGNIVPGTPATQISHGSYNELYVYQWQDNEIGLYQEAEDYNFADISQNGQKNSLGIYQTNASGFNSLVATQGGNQTATVIQNTTSGDGVINVNQGP